VRERDGYNRIRQQVIERLVNILRIRGVSLSQVTAFEFPACLFRTYLPLPCNNVFLSPKFLYKSHPPTKKVAVGCLRSQPFVAYLFPSVCFPLAPTSSHPPREGPSKKKQKHNTASFPSAMLRRVTKSGTSCTKNTPRFPLTA
jgi:hypothetical protein